MIFWGDCCNLPTFAKIIRKMKIKMVGRWYLGVYTVIPLYHSFPVSYDIVFPSLYAGFLRKVLHNIWCNTGVTDGMVYRRRYVLSLRSNTYARLTPNGINLLRAPWGRGFAEHHTNALIDTIEPKNSSRLAK
jgi:hypothetical protein